MTEKEMVLILSTVFMTTQIIYFMISRNSTNRIIENHHKSMKIILDSITAVTASFEPHIERTRSVHEMVEGLKQQHNVRDAEGQLMWYTPNTFKESHKEILTVSQNIAKITQETSGTLREISVLIREIAKKLEAHQENCKEQFHKVEKSIDHATFDCRTIKDMA